MLGNSSDGRKMLRSSIMQDLCMLVGFQENDLIIVHNTQSIRICQPPITLYQLVHIQRVSRNVAMQRIGIFNDKVVLRIDMQSRSIVLEMLSDMVGCFVGR